MKWLLVLLLSLVLSGMGFAATTKDSSPGEIRAYYILLQARIEDGRMSGLQSGEKRRLERYIADAQSLLGTHASWDQVSAQDRASFVARNDQVTEILNSATKRSEKRICTRSAPTGSNLPKLICRTRAEIDEQRREARDALRGNDVKPRF